MANTITPAFRISDMTNAAQDVVRTYGLDADGNGSIDGADAETIDRVVPTITGSDRAIADNVRQSLRDGLALPRTDGARDRIAASTTSKRTLALSTDDLKAATVDERVSLIKSITGDTFVFDKKERRILDILNRTPDHQKPALVKALVDGNLLKKMLSKIDGQENKELRAFIGRFVYMIGEPDEVAKGMSDLKFSSQTTFSAFNSMRAARGDAFAERVAAELLASGYFERTLPFVWADMTISSSDKCDPAALATWKMQKEMMRQQDQAKFNAFITCLPEGPTKQALVQTFSDRHNMNRFLDGLDVLTCVLDNRRR